MNKKEVVEDRKIFCVLGTCSIMKEEINKIHTANPNHTLKLFSCNDLTIKVAFGFSVSSFTHKCFPQNVPHYDKIPI